MAGTASPQATLIRLSARELSSGEMGSHSLQAALEALHRDGLVVLENAVSRAHLDALRARMEPDARKLLADASTHRNFGPDTGNLQQEPPTGPDLVFADVVANPFATAVVACALGPRPALRFHSANTAVRATARQPVHVDVDFPYPVAHMPWAYCLNVNLVDVGPANGSTEFWLGSHLLAPLQPPGRDIVPPDLLEARRAVCPPVQPCLPQGSLIIRDMRLWHAGMPNRTDDPRVMLVSVLFPHWYRSRLAVRLPRSLEGKIEWWGELDAKIEWVDDGYDYLKGAHDFTFAQDD